MAESSLTFPDRLARVANRLREQEPTLRQVATCFADALVGGGVVRLYANGHSRIAVEEWVVRMGALTGFQPLVSDGLASFLDVVGPSGIRVNQAIERCEGLGVSLLAEVDPAPGEPLVVISATGQTAAAVDTARAWLERFPTHPLVVICCEEQARTAPPKHSSGETLWHVVQRARPGWLLDNAMPIGDLSVEVSGQTGRYNVCPLSSIGALSLVQSLNELTIRELDRRGVGHHVLRNMHLARTEDNYDAWLRDQRARYARALAPRA